MALAGLKRTLSGTPEDGVTRSAATSNGNGSEEWTTVSGGSRKKQKKEKKKAEKAKGKEVSSRDAVPLDAVQAALSYHAEHCSSS